MPFLLGNLKKFIPYGIILVLIVMLSVSQCQKQTIKQTVSTPDSTGFFKKELKAIQAQGKAKLQKLEKDLLEIKATAKAHKQAADKATKERDVARRKIQEIVNTVPEVKEFVDLDSVSDKLATDRIKQLEIEHLTITDDFKAVLHSRDEELKVSHEYADHLQVVIKDLTHEVKKQRRIKTLWKIVSGVLVAVVIYEAVQD